MRISLFMKKFIDAIQIDDDVNISEEEIDNLRNILHFRQSNSKQPRLNLAGRFFVLIDIGRKAQNVHSQSGKFTELFTFPVSVSRVLL